MPTQAQLVLEIQDASRELCTDGMRYALLSLSLKPGDKIKLLRVVPAFKATSALCRILQLMRKSKLHSSATYRRKQIDIKKEIEEKKHEFANSEKVSEIHKLAEAKQVKLELEVEGGSLRDVAVEHAKNFGATTVILDRQLKKDQKYFAKNLSCAISRMKHDNSVTQIRGPRATEDRETSQDRVQRNYANQGTGTRKQHGEISPLCSLCQNRRPGTGNTREFSWSELQSATSGFSLQNLLSANGSKVYEGRLCDGQRTVIREHNSTTIKSKQFSSKIQKLGSVRHENVAILLGSCSKGSRHLLVYEYICNGSLNKHLSKKSTELTWERRVRIAHGAAKGLEHLHRLELYGNMRPSNILLTHDHQPLLANIGLVRNYYEASNQSSDTRVLKTFEYMAPECEENGIDLSKADVYSFGVVLLELITGRKTIDDTYGQSFLRWARPLLRQKRFHDLIDPALQDSNDLHQLYWMVRLAEKCICWDPERRLSIHKVVRALACISEGSKMECISPTDSELMEHMCRTRYICFGPMHDFRFDRK